MAKLIVGAIVIAVMFCGTASADERGIGVGAGTVGMETPTGLPVGTIATETPTATPTSTPTQTEIPPTPTYFAVIRHSACAVVGVHNQATSGWWLVLAPLAIAWRRYYRRTIRKRSDE